MVLYGFWRSSATWRVRIALGHKQLEHEYRPVNLIADGGGDQHRAEYRALNPMRQVPTLELTEEDGSVVRIAQSLAIAEYLDERWPERPLLPRERLARARTRQIAEMINAGIQPLQNTSVRDHVQGKFGADPDVWCRHWIERGLDAVEAVVQGSAGKFAVGDEPTIADMCLVPQLYHARRYGLDSKAFVTLTRIESACAELEAFARARPERQPDAPKR
ncbi:MAG: maleylacetoacetate isomerase [Polyangiaceae bacterium]